MIPKKLKVGGHVYEVVFPHSFVSKEDLDGLTAHSKKTIYIEAGVEQDQTLWHEILHCIDKVYNANDLDEEVITRLSEGLYQVLVDNFCVSPKVL